MSKDTFHAAFDDITVRVFKNTKAGIADLIEMTQTLGGTPSDTQFGVESTGVYHLLVCTELRSRGWQIQVINPLLTAQMIKTGLRMVKNDRKDAKVVRLAVLMGKGYPFRDTPEILALKALISEREDIVSMRSDLKRRQYTHELRARASGCVLHESYARAATALDASIRDIDTKTQ